MKVRGQKCNLKREKKITTLERLILWTNIFLFFNLSIYVVGFEEIDSGCCGSGYIEATILCNKFSNLCPDPSKYLFWDSIHPTEKAYHNLFLAFQPTIDFIANN
jgi:hypothetical protein